MIAPFVAAGFYFIEGKFLHEVPFDPFLPWIFMGEEILLSSRFLIIQRQLTDKSSVLTIIILNSPPTTTHTHTRARALPHYQTMDEWL